MNLPTLYKNDSQNRLRVWNIETGLTGYVVTHGLQNGKQISDTTICTAKNVGRSNESTAASQANLEAHALWDKKFQRDGYKTDIDSDDLFIRPMLARDYSKLAHQIPDTESLYLSPKLDGVRCIWVPGLGLQSRKGLLYKVPHLEQALGKCPVLLDGELYIHGQPLNRIISACKKPNDLTPLLEFRVFDVVSVLGFYTRHHIYTDVVDGLGDSQIQSVPQVKALKTEIKKYHDEFVADGYEGVMIRSLGFGYERGTRSSSLYKYKEFEEAEFPIVGVGVDKDGGGILKCDGFNVRMRGTDESRALQSARPEDYIGRHVTVRYFALTEYGIPQFPVGIAIRED